MRWSEQYYFVYLIIRRPPRATRTDTRFPYTTLFRSLTHGALRVTGLSGYARQTGTPARTRWASSLRLQLLVDRRRLDVPRSAGRSLRASEPTHPHQQRRHLPHRGTAASGEDRKSVV